MLLAVGLLAVSGCGGPASPTPTPSRVHYVEPDSATGTSSAVVVPPLRLAVTTNFLPYDASGQMVGRDDPRLQTRQVLDNIEAALEAAGAELHDIVKVNAYVRDQRIADVVLDQLRETFSGEAKPAITFAEGRLRHADADVAMDVVAMAADDTDPGVHLRTPAVYGYGDRSHAAILPERGHVYVSGQVARGDDLIAATRETFEASLARLSYLGLPAASIEQVKVFLSDIDRVDTVEAVLADYFREKPAPPIVSLEWVHESYDIEIEMIASTPYVDADRSITFSTPPGLRAVPVYSRVATIHNGSVVYVSGLVGDSTQTGEEQIREIFGQFERILPQAGTDFDHLAKGQYYVSDWDVVSPLGTVRGEYYHPETPPTSSLIPVRGVAVPGRRITIDLIGVAPPERP